MKLFIWTGFCPDYTSGLAFAIAKDETDARKQIEKYSGFDVYTWGELEIRRLDRCVARYVSGGGQMKLPEVDYQFFIDAIIEAKPEEADAIMGALKKIDSGKYNINGFNMLGKTVLTQIEKYRQEIRDIDIEADQPLKRGRGNYPL